MTRKHLRSQRAMQKLDKAQREHPDTEFTGPELAEISGYSLNGIRKIEADARRKLRKSPLLKQLWESLE